MPNAKCQAPLNMKKATPLERRKPTPFNMKEATPLERRKPTPLNTKKPTPVKEGVLLFS